MCLDMECIKSNRKNMWIKKLCYIKLCHAIPTLGFSAWNDDLLLQLSDLNCSLGVLDQFIIIYS